MKTTSGIITLIFLLLTLLNIAGCIKSHDDYDRFLKYKNSVSGAVESFARGFQQGSQGDIFGATLDIVSQERTLREEANSSSFWAWTCVLVTIVFGGIYFAFFLTPISNFSKRIFSQLEIHKSPSEMEQTKSINTSVDNWKIWTVIGCLTIILIGVVIYSSLGFKGLIGAAIITVLVVKSLPKKA